LCWFVPLGCAVGFVLAALIIVLLQWIADHIGQMANVVLQVIGS
jgi:hypothetical protein